MVLLGDRGSQAYQRATKEMLKFKRRIEKAALGRIRDPLDIGGNV